MGTKKTFEIHDLSFIFVTIFLQSSGFLLVSEFKKSVSDLLSLLYVPPGRLGLLDYDEVELSNLHRQVLHGEENQGQAKALSAARAVRRY